MYATVHIHGSELAIPLPQREVDMNLGGMALLAVTILIFVVIVVVVVFRVGSTREPKSPSDS